MSDKLGFMGFPVEGLRFLEELNSNNNKEWFEENRESFRDYLQEPAQVFVETVGKQIQQMVSGNIRYDLRLNGSGSLMRIYRDTRFSKDKTPYKTRQSGMLWEGAGKKTVSPAFGFEIKADRMGIMAGMFQFEKEFMHAYRGAVADNETGSQLVKALGDIAAAGNYKIGGEQYKRVPKEYPQDHPRADLLKYKGLWVSTDAIKPQTMTSPGIVDIVVEHFINMAPLQQWLVQVAKKV